MPSGKYRKSAMPSRIPPKIDPILWEYIKAFKEHIEIYEGSRGNTDTDMVLTRGDLATIGIDPRVLLGTIKYNFSDSIRDTNKIKIVLVNYLLLEDDNIILADTGLGNIEITLPSAVGLRGYDYTIKRITAGSETLTVTPFGSQTIDGDATQVIQYKDSAMNIYSDNQNWYIG